MNYILHLLNWKKYQKIFIFLYLKLSNNVVEKIPSTIFVTYLSASPSFPNAHKNFTLALEGSFRQRVGRCLPYTFYARGTSACRNSRACESASKSIKGAAARLYPPYPYSFHNAYPYVFVNPFFASDASPRATFNVLFFLPSKHIFFYFLS